MIVTIKSTRNHLKHLEFVFMVMHFATKIIEEKGHAHIVIETEHDLSEIDDIMKGGYGPLEIIPE